MKFEEVLQAAENGSLTKRHVDKLLKCMEDDNVYRPLFKHYVSQRLRANIHPERLLSLAYNLEKHLATQIGRAHV